MNRHILWLGLRPGYAVRVCSRKRSAPNGPPIDAAVVRCNAAYGLIAPYKNTSAARRLLRAKHQANLPSPASGRGDEDPITFQRRSIAIPMRAIEMPALAALLPTLGRPTVTVALVDPTPVYPHVPMPAPVPVARPPDIARACCRNDFHLRLRRRDVDIDVHARTTNRRRGSRADSQSNTQYCSSN